MHQFEIILALLVAVVLLGIAARRLGVPSPVLLVIGGLVIALLPGLPPVEFEPRLIFVVFIPPLLYRAALTSSWRDLRANVRPITLLAVGLVVFTTVVVGIAAHVLAPGLPWAAAFALGALVSPPDAPAATAFLRGLVVPRRVATILEGESLVNDAAAIVAYRMAVAAAVSGTFSWGAAGPRFVWVGTTGIVVGLVVAWLIAWLRRRIHAPEIEATISLLTPFAAFLPAEALGVSGVLAVRACRLYPRRQGPRPVAPATRAQTEGMWGVIGFVLEGLTFIFVGLELRPVLGTLGAHSVRQLALAGVAVSLATIAARGVWVFAASYGPRRLSRHARTRDPLMSWRHVALIAWAGLRGADSLVLALALPFATAAGAPFPGRALIIFLTYVVILVTLLVQGFSLQPFVNRLGICDTGETQRLEEAHAREQASAAALRRLDELASGPDEATLTELRARYGHRRRPFLAPGAAGVYRAPVH